MNDLLAVFAEPANAYWSPAPTSVEDVPAPVVSGAAPRVAWPRLRDVPRSTMSPSRRRWHAAIFGRLGGRAA